jgi:hypothetical protein
MCVYVCIYIYTYVNCCLHDAPYPKYTVYTVKLYGWLLTFA